MVTTENRLSGRSCRGTVQAEKAFGEIELALEAERLRLSIEIHDGVAQSMTGALHRIQACGSYLSPSGPGRLKDELAEIEKILQRSVGELRRVIGNLRPLPLEELGLSAAVRSMADSLRERGIRCSIELEEVLPKLTLSEEKAIYGVIREAVTNVANHSGATIGCIRLWSRGRTVSVEVQDNGCGFDPAEIACRTGNGHLGLLGMTDTARLIGGRLRIDSRPGQGTLLRFLLRTRARRTSAGRRAPQRAGLIPGR